jgi:hypothetical protein
VYAHIDNFPIDKATNTIIEEGIAPVYIRAYYMVQGKRIWRVDKKLDDLKGSKAYDLIDGMGVTWEVKADRLWHVTGNVYIELQALEASQADKYLILAGRGYVVAKSALCEAIRGYEAKAGGDHMRSLGVTLPLEVLEEVAESVIVL